VSLSEPQPEEAGAAFDWLATFFEANRADFVAPSSAAERTQVVRRRGGVGSRRGESYVVSAMLARAEKVIIWPRMAPEGWMETVDGQHWGVAWQPATGVGESPLRPRGCQKPDSRCRTPLSVIEHRVWPSGRAKTPRRPPAGATPTPTSFSRHLLPPGVSGRNGGSHRFPACAYHRHSRDVRKQVTVPSFPTRAAHEIASCTGHTRPCLRCRTGGSV
jgi:hypothetical protein